MLSAAPRHVLPSLQGQHEEADSNANLEKECCQQAGLVAAATELPMPKSAVQMQRLSTSKPCTGQKTLTAMKARTMKSCAAGLRGRPDASAGIQKGMQPWPQGNQ